MSTGELHLETLRRLASTPFLDRLELAAVSGVPDRSAYSAAAVLERQGLTADRTGFAKRLWRLRDGPLPGGVFLLLPDEIRLRHARRLAAAAPFPVLLSLERDVVRCGPTVPSGNFPL